MNGMTMLKDELFKAACCNLGESFVANPSVDVNYSDAATGARQIKLLGLSGTYVQMLTENLPAFRGASAPFALGYVPGAWMKSIQVSKGASSVKNGYESVTGQINVEYLKPEDDEGLSLNLFGTSMGRFEANADGNLHFSESLCTNILAHFENNWSHHDANHDGFLDEPRVRQYNFQNRWVWKQGRYMFHGGWQVLDESRSGGQTLHAASAADSGESHAGHASTGLPLYRIGVETDRYEAYMKHAVVLDGEHGTNIALMATASLHEQEALYGRKGYDVDEKNAYASLMFETSFAPEHNLSLGLSINHDYFSETTNGLLSGPEGLPTGGETGATSGTIDPEGEPESLRMRSSETVPGAYVQYTFNHHERLIAMAGLRIDRSNLWGTFVTPRVHIKYMPADFLTFRASAGKGYRTPHALAESHYLLASGRRLVVGDLKQERAWNYGLSAALYVPLARKTLRLNAEYYYTHFASQVVVDYDSDSRQIRIDNLAGRSYSHTFQVDATYPFFKGFELTAAWRYNDVRTTYGGLLLRKPLTGRYKGLLSASYKTPLGIWQFDANLQLNGGGRLPKAYLLADGAPSWAENYHAYEQLSAQVTRWFRHFSIYVGGENLTNFRQKCPIISADAPWSGDFEPTLAWGPVQGTMLYAGIRLNFGKHL